MRIVLFILVFMLLCGPRLKFPDLNLLFTFLLAIVSPFLLIYSKKLSRELRVFIIITFLILISSVFTVLINGVEYYEPFFDFASLLLTCLASYSLVTFYQNKFTHDFHRPLIQDIQLAYLINCLFVVFIMFIPGVGTFSAEVLSQNSKMVGLADESIRSFDLVMGGGAVASIVFSVVFVFSLSTYLIHKDVLSLLSMIFAMLGVLFTGRTGLYITLLSILPMILLFNYIKLGSFRVLYVLFWFLKILIFSACLLGVFFYLMYLLFPTMFELVIINNFSWAFEPIINLFNTGSFTTLSTSRLKEMYSSSDLDFANLFSFFGTSLSGRDDTYLLRTDIGYLRVLFTSGFLGVMLIFGKNIYILIVACLKANNFKGTIMEIPFLLALIYYSFVILLVNFKEYHMTVRSGLPLLMILFITIFNSNKSIKKTS